MLLFCMLKSKIIINKKKIRTKYNDKREILDIREIIEIYRIYETSMELDFFLIIFNLL